MMGSAAGELELPEGVAVNTSGDVLVADTGNHRVDEFTEAGAFVLTFGKDVNKTKVESGLGNQEEDDVCTEVEVAMSSVECQAGTAGTEAGELERSSGIAVDDSSSVSTGDVYVADPGPKVATAAEEEDRVEKFSPDGAYQGDLTGRCKNAGEKPPGCIGFVKFLKLRGVAVDTSGDVWVYGYENKAREPGGEIVEFNAEGEFEQRIEDESQILAEPSAGLAVDPHDGLYFVTEGEEVGKWDVATNREVDRVKGETSKAVAVNPSTGNVLIAKAVVRRSAEIRVDLFPPFLESNTPVETFPAPAETALSEVYGLGVSGASGSAFISERGSGKIAIFAKQAVTQQPPVVRTSSPTEVGGAAVTLQGTAGREGESITSCEFEYGPSEAAPGAYPEKAACSPIAPFTGTKSVSARIANLEERHTYHYRLTAKAASGLSASSEDGTVFTTTRPLIEKEKVTNAGATEAVVAAYLDPAGARTEYYVEYGTSPAYGSKAPVMPVSTGEGTIAMRVEVRLTGLEQNTTYDVRLTARNEDGVSYGEALAVTTSIPSSSVMGLPDGRQYEVVSTARANSEVYVPETIQSSGIKDIPTDELYQVSASGGAVAYNAEPPTTGGNGNLGLGEGDEWLAHRGAEGWEAQVISPAGAAFAKEVFTPFQAFSNDFAVSFMEATLQPPLAEGAPTECQVLYARSSVTGLYRTLFTKASPGECGHPLLAGQSNDGEAVIFQSEAALTSDAVRAEELPAGHTSHHGHGQAEEVGEPCEFGCNLYESVYDRETGEPVLALVNLLPEGEGVATSASFGGLSEVGNRPDFSDVMSGDGSRIYWTDTQALLSGNPNPDFDHVFVLENGTMSVQVSGSGRAEYWTATPDGRYAYYTEDGVLWRFNSEPEVDHEPERERIAEKGVRGEGANVQGVVAINTTGDDGEYVYFVAASELAPGAEPLNCKTAAEEREEMGATQKLTEEEEEEEHGGSPPGRGCNLYVLHGGVATFIAALSPQDDELAFGTGGVTGGDWAPSLAERTAEATDNGQHLVFESRRELTGYENRKVDNGQIPIEVFMYSAKSGKLVCASCDPAGTPPQIEAQQHNATLLPVSKEDTFMPRWITADGDRVFFEVQLPLVDTDTNNVGDIYEWEEEGAGSCTKATSVYGGCVYLLSSGQGSDASIFVGASESGADVFFTSRVPLVRAENSEVTQLYDAHECSTEAPCVQESARACVGTDCQESPRVSLMFAVPPTSTESGTETFSPATSTRRKRTLTRAQRLARALKACRAKRNKTKRRNCERQARKRYGSAVKRKKRTVRRGKSPKRSVPHGGNARKGDVRR